MVGVQDQQLVDCAFNDGVYCVLLGWEGKHHLEEVSAVAQFIGWINRRMSHVVLVRLCGEGRQLGNQPVNGQFDVDDGAVGILGFWVERAQA